jgi:hypothetical protein
MTWLVCERKGKLTLHRGPARARLCRLDSGGGCGERFGGARDA